MGCLSAKQATSNPSQTPVIIPTTTARRSSRAGVHELKQQYNINKKVLGSGSFGKVFQAENKADVSH
jgi:calcium-dependent protein kinase